MVEGQLAMSCEFALYCFTWKNMIEHRNINANESGLSIRAKLNRMFSDLISGTEGVNKLWKRLVEINSAVNANVIETSNLKDELQNRLSDVLGYTDREINDLLSYVNGMEGGVNGFAEDTSFQPNYPEDVAATVIGVGPGTFTNMIGENGSAITVDSVSVIIFFKAAGSTYWKYKTILPTVVHNEVTGEFGDSTSKVINQKFFTSISKGVVGGSIDVTDISSLDNYNSPSQNGLYALKKGNTLSGLMLVSSSLGLSGVYQFVFGGFNVNDGALTSGEGGILAYRKYNLGWSSWRLLQDDFEKPIEELQTKYQNLQVEINQVSQSLSGEIQKRIALSIDVQNLRNELQEGLSEQQDRFKVMTEDEYNALVASGEINNDVFYFLFEE